MPEATEDNLKVDQILDAIKSALKSDTYIKSLVEDKYGNALILEEGFEESDFYTDDTAIAVWSEYEINYNSRSSRGLQLQNPIIYIDVAKKEASCGQELDKSDGTLRLTRKANYKNCISILKTLELDENNNLSGSVGDWEVVRIVPFGRLQGKTMPFSYWHQIILKFFTEISLN